MERRSSIGRAGIGARLAQDWLLREALLEIKAHAEQASHALPLQAPRFQTLPKTAKH